MGSQLAPLQIHSDELDSGGDTAAGANVASSGTHVKTGGGQKRFRVNDGTVPPTSFVVSDSVEPYIREGAWESTYHSKEDMHTFGLFAHGVLSRHLRLAGMRDCVRLGVNGSFEIAGVSSNVHKLEWYFFNQDGSYVGRPEYDARAKEYWQSGIVGRGGGGGGAETPQQNLERQRLFQEKCAEFVTDDDEVVGIDEMIEFLRGQCAGSGKIESSAGDTPGESAADRGTLRRSLYMLQARCLF